MMSECPHAELVVNEVLSDWGHVMLDLAAFGRDKMELQFMETDKRQLN